MSNLGGFDLDGPWATAAKQIALSMTEGVDPRDLELPMGQFSEVGVELYSREYCAAAGTASLSVVYGVASVGVCTATQGAWTTMCPLHGGGWLEVPTIQYFMAVADSGVGKSTILDAARRPLTRALQAGVSSRTTRITELRAQAERWARENLAEEQGLGGPKFDAKQFAALYNAGISPVTVVKDPTMEALGQLLVNNGGHGAVLSAEAELFRSMTAYNSDGGSLSLLLDQWSQESISTIRVARGLVEMDNVSLNLAVLFQGDVFADVTGGVTGRSGGGDSFISRGVFGRSWVTRALHLGGYERLAQFYGENDDEAYVGDGMTMADGNRTPLGLALHSYEDNLHMLVEESNRYRESKAMHRAWRLGLIEHGADYQPGEPPLPVRHEMRLDANARAAYRRVQRMRLYIEGRLADPRIDDDVRAVFVPLASRLTQHIMREAAVISLGSGFRVISGDAIMDAATRIIPWRVAHSADALLTRQAEVTQALMAQAAVSNPGNIDTSTLGIVARHLATLASLKPKQARDEGFTRGQIRDRARQPLVRQRGSGIGIAKIVGDALAQLLSDPASGVTLDTSGVDAAGHSVERYRVDNEFIGRWTR